MYFSKQIKNILFQWFESILLKYDSLKWLFLINSDVINLYLMYRNENKLSLAIKSVNKKQNEFKILILKCLSYILVVILKGNNDKMYTAHQRELKYQ